MCKNLTVNINFMIKQEKPLANRIITAHAKMSKYHAALTALKSNKMILEAITSIIFITNLFQKNIPKSLLPGFTEPVGRETSVRQEFCRG